MTHPTLLQQADAPLGTSIDTTDKLSGVDALPLLDDEVAVDTFEALDFMVQLSAPFRYRHGRLVAILL